MANRLSENPKWKVLLLEAGGYESTASDIPVAAQNLQLSSIDWAYTTEPQEAACFGLKNHVSAWPRGRVLGGSSVLNFMLYVRGNRRDYDHWAHLGNHGWSWKDVFPYFIKSEDNRDPEIVKNGHHGVGGYLTVSSPPDITPVAALFPEAGKFLGYPQVDINGPIQAGFTTPQGTTRDGSRCSTAKAFLRPIRKRKNLHVLTHAQVTKILINENKKAFGVQFFKSGAFHSVLSREEIIVSGGTVNSPQLLMLSGIGPKDHLASLGIPVVSDLPVGLNLQDQVYAGGIHFKVNESVALVVRKVTSISNLISYFTKGRGPLTALGGCEGLGFIKTRYANASDDYPDFEIHFVSAGPVADDGSTFRHIMRYSEEMWQQVYKPYLFSDSFTLFPVLLRPKSRGYIKLRSADPFEAPIINPRYLTHPDDLLRMVDAMKISIAVGYSPVYEKYGATLFNTRFPGCEAHAMWSDDYLACVARSYTGTIYHPVGTCRMGPESDARSVVDPEFRVLGVKGLRVVDGSIMPTIVSGNTNAPIIMLGERAADFIKASAALRRGENLPLQLKREGHQTGDSDANEIADNLRPDSDISARSPVDSSPADRQSSEDRPESLRSVDIDQPPVKSGVTNFKFVEQVMGRLIKEANR